ncbi:S-adenosylmethionine synthase [Trichinella pseudospiralis]
MTFHETNEVTKSVSTPCGVEPAPHIYSQVNAFEHFCGNEMEKLPQALPFEKRPRRAQVGRPYSLASSEDLCRAVAGINCPQLRELRKSVNNNNTSERDADGIDHFSLSDRFRLNLYGSF